MSLHSFTRLATSVIFALFITGAAAVVSVVSVASAAAAAAAAMILTPQETAQALAHGPWPPQPTLDPSNRVSGNGLAIEFGQTLFSDPRLSRDGTVSCATCHEPARDFSQSRPRAMGRVLLDRNTPALTNLGTHRWFGWAGTSDNLWGQSILPIIHPMELDSSAETLKQTITSSPLSMPYAKIFGAAEQHQPQAVLVNIGKALAAYQETLVTGKTSFDRFRDALQQGDFTTASNYSESAQRGLQLFLGKGRCGFCHSGPSFTNGEFHDAGVPYFLERGRVDAGRHQGLQKLFASPFTLDGGYNDDPEKTGAWAVRSVRTSHADFGRFRVPGLRGVARTAPYMHNGSLADLRAVISHYSTMNMERLHADGEAILRPLNLTPRKSEDLLMFLESLSDETSRSTD